MPFVTSETCVAKICRSGSAIEMKKPSTSPIPSTYFILLLRAKPRPRNFPIGVMPRSTPKRKMDRPMMIKNAPNRKRCRSIVSSGVKVKWSRTTSSVIGITDCMTSLNFSVNIRIDSILSY